MALRLRTKLSENGMTPAGVYRWLTAVEFRPSERLWIDLRPDMDECVPWFPRFQFGGDEYGNSSVFFRAKLLSVVFFYERIFQRDIEMPQPGECSWVDRRYYCSTQEEYESASWTGPVCPKHNKPGFRGHFTSAVGCDDCITEYQRKANVAEMVKRFLNRAMETIEKEMHEND